MRTARGLNGQEEQHELDHSCSGGTVKPTGSPESIRTLNGDEIKVDHEGSAQGANQTMEGSLSYSELTASV
jgi:hypothetical protein